MSNSCCRKVQDQRFTLSGCASECFVPGPEAQVLWLEYHGRTPEKTVVKNALVWPGMVLARHEDAGRGDLCCPVLGVVTDAAATGLLITVGMPAPKAAKKVEGEAAQAPEPVTVPVTEARSLDGLSGAELAAVLKELGMCTGKLTQPCTTLIINGLNPDPGVAWAEPMLNIHADDTAAGIELLRRLTPAGTVVLAMAEGGETALTGIDIAHVTAQYPASLDPLVALAVTGREAPEDVQVVGLHQIWELGRIARTGQPLTHTVLTLGGINYIVAIGTSVRDLLDMAGIGIQDGDVVAFNSALRGEAQTRLQAGVSARTYAVFVIRREDAPPLDGDAACISCGECVQVCPARLQPDQLSRFSEFGMDEKCRNLHIDACMDCGLCTYVCINRRPVLQYLRLARQRLAAKATAQA